MPARLLTISEVAARLGLHKSTIYGMLRDGVLPSVKTAQTARRVRESDLDAYIESLPALDYAESVAE